MFNWFYLWKYKRGIAKFEDWLWNNHACRVHYLSRRWPGMPINIKEPILERLIEAYSAQLTVIKCRKKPGDKWITANCFNHALVRCCLLGNFSHYHPGLWQSDYTHYGEVRKGKPDIHIGLPIYFATVIWPNGYAHQVCAAYMGPMLKGWEDLKNWWFFQYQVVKIDVGHSPQHIPKGSQLSIINHTKDDIFIEMGKVVGGDPSNRNVAQWKLAG